MAPVDAGDPAMNLRVFSFPLTVYRTSLRLVFRSQSREKFAFHSAISIVRPIKLNTIESIRAECVGGKLAYLVERLQYSTDRPRLFGYNVYMKNAHNAHSRTESNLAWLEVTNSCLEPTNTEKFPT